MKSILFSSEGAEILNNKISSRIAHHIILFCHYNPSVCMVYSSDAKFIAGILNIYKFLIDCGIAGKLSNLRKYAKIANNFEKDKALVCALRTVFGHNKSLVNDYEDALGQYSTWLKTQIGKDEITCVEEYEILLNALEVIGQNLYLVISEFIDELAKKSNIDDVVIDIEKMWMQYYKSSSGRAIILTQMWNMYMTSHGLSYEEISLREKENKLKLWCQEYYCGKIQSEITSLNNAIDILGKRMKPADLVKVQSSLDEKEKKLEAIRTEAQKERGYLELYIKRINEESIQNEINNIKMDKSRSLLPEDLIQSILDTDFANVR